MFKEIVEKELYCFHERFDKWKDSILACTKPLIEKKVIDQRYVDKIFESIDKYGPYIVLAPDVAMPHSTENCAGVFGTEIGFMRVKNPVHFVDGNPDKDARIFFTLASVDSNEHLNQMIQLATLLADKEFVQACIEANTKEDLLEIAEKFES